MPRGRGVMEVMEVMEDGTIGLHTIGVMEAQPGTIRLLWSLSCRLRPRAGSEVRSGNISNMKYFLNELRRSEITMTE